MRKELGRVIQPLMGFIIPNTQQSRAPWDHHIHRLEIRPFATHSYQTVRAGLLTECPRW